MRTTDEHPHRLRVYALAFYLSLAGFGIQCHAAIVIEYVIRVGQDNPLVDKSLFVPKRMTVSMHKNSVRVQSISDSSLGERFDLYDVKRDFYYVCMDVMGQRKAFKSDRDKYDISYPHDSVYNVIGYPCRKAIAFDAENGIKIEIYYTDSFGIKFFQHGELDGIAIKYTRTDRIFGNITYEAVSVQAGDLQDDLFSISGFTVSPAKKRSAEQRVWIGKTLPLLKASYWDKADATVHVRGKVTVVNFWFLGCMPCRQEIPYLNRLVEKYDSSLYKDKIQFIAIALDGPEAVTEFLKKENDFKYTLLTDGKRSALKCKVPSYPTHFVVNDSGTVVDEWFRYTPVTVYEIDKVIEGLLKP